MNSLFPNDTLQRIRSCGVIAVLVIDDAAHAVSLAKSLLAGGIDVMELTLRTDAAIESLRRIRSEVPEMMAGVGTILRADQIKVVADAGAAFGVAPGFSPGVVKSAQDQGLPFAPGILTPSEIEAAVELGCRELKIFPAQASGGMKYLGSISAPYNHLGLQYVPLGGINAANMVDYLRSPIVPAVGGSWIATRQLIAEQQWESIAANAKEARREVDRLREETQETI
ncbi:bifunctional 4-hydroxy-2-oxoglutarate aldolase/2-dehydro-3-deoxy-phosphogluconate aldolase [Planctomycetes bacterium K23_9]|uniref:2-dehydro-3-deoxy-phosphogluconate aldolase n=1 Tax=Stieleria marina TaxID=1930275 RepID=A0A517P386_9BACT|nr:Putative KHG/KDPG aldolase [Planctomycetes bacterium K23_9]